MKYMNTFNNIIAIDSLVFSFMSYLRNNKGGSQFKIINKMFLTNQFEEFHFSALILKLHLILVQYHPVQISKNKSSKGKHKR